MPRLGTTEFFGGYARAQVEQIRKLVHNLEETPNLTMGELNRMKQSVVEIDRELSTQAKALEDSRANNIIKWHQKDWQMEWSNWIHNHRHLTDQ